MITNLHIENYVLIDHLDINFQAGLNIITGETGAGKSILLGALALLKGARVDPSVINNGKRCIIEATFECEGYCLESLFEDLDLEYSDQTVIKRVILESGKSRAYVNDLPVQLTQLKTLSESLIDIHSQHQTLLVGTNSFQMEVVDCIAKNGELLDKYQLLFSKYQNKKNELTALKEKASAAKKEEEFLRYQYSLLEEAVLKGDEKDTLEEQHKLLANSEQIKNALVTSVNVLSESDEAVLTNIKIAVNNLSEISDVSSVMNELYERLESSFVELKDIARELEKMGDNVTSDPKELEKVEDRLNTIYSLEQRFHVTSIDELLVIQAELDNKIQAIDNSDDDINSLRAELELILVEVKVLAEKLEVKRRKVLPSIEKTILLQLKDLGMFGSTLKIELETLGELNSLGQNIVRFMFSANEGGMLEKIDKVASGGEMSRLMLTLKTMMSEYKSLPTIIFDEIDTGVSGAVADKMGLIMEQLGSSKQVINITHLPQVASKGEHHFFVSKRSEQGKTTTIITKLDPQSRIEHIASMLSGKGLTDAALEQAKKLLYDKNQ